MKIKSVCLLFVVSIFFCNIQIQAMDDIANNFYKSIASGNKDKMNTASIELLTVMFSPASQNIQKTAHGWVFCSEPLPKNEQPLGTEQSLQPDEILELVPSDIEFSNAKDQRIFNVLATLKFFEYVIQHYEFVFLLPKKFHSFTKEKFEEHFRTLSLYYSTELKQIRMSQAKISKIQAMVDNNLQAIIENRISNLS